MVRETGNKKSFELEENRIGFRQFRRKQLKPTIMRGTFHMTGSDDNFKSC